MQIDALWFSQHKGGEGHTANAKSSTKASFLASSSANCSSEERGAANVDVLEDGETEEDADTTRGGRGCGTEELGLAADDSDREEREGPETPRETVARAFVTGSLVVAAAGGAAAENRPAVQADQEEEDAGVDEDGRPVLRRSGHLGCGAGVVTQLSLYVRRDQDYYQPHHQEY
jgi:hypothetical protein